MFTLWKTQPPAFPSIFLLEMAERFGFYNIQGVLILYLIRVLDFSDSQAYFTFGAFYALVYGTVSLGGYIADHVIGTKRTIVIGMLTLCMGYLSLSLGGKSAIFWSLGLICIGNGLFKATPTSLLSKCYQKNDSRLHSGFTLYYMSINIGATLAFFVGPLLTNHFGYGYTYFVSFIGLLLGLVNYALNQRYIKPIPSTTDSKSVSYWTWMGLCIGIILFTSLATYLLQHILLAKKLLLVVILLVGGIYFKKMYQENIATRKSMWVAFILMLEGILFYVLYQQMPTSINLFAVHHVIPSLLGIALDPQSFQALNPIGIILFGPIMAYFYQQLDKRNITFPTPYKFAVGMFFCGLSFFVLYLARFLHDDQGMVSSWWLIASYVFQSGGELLVSALGLAMVAELVPNHMTGFVIGMWFLTTAIAGFLGATVASFTALPQQIQPGIDSLYIYTNVFGIVGATTILISVFLLIVAFMIKNRLKV